MPANTKFLKAYFCSNVKCKNYYKNCGFGLPPEKEIDRTHTARCNLCNEPLHGRCARCKALLSKRHKHVCAVNGKEFMWLHQYDWCEFLQRHSLDVKNEQIEQNIESVISDNFPPPSPTKAPRKSPSNKRKNKSRTCGKVSKKVVQNETQMEKAPVTQAVDVPENTETQDIVDRVSLQYSHRSSSYEIKNQKTNTKEKNSINHMVSKQEHEHYLCHGFDDLKETRETTSIADFLSQNTYLQNNCSSIQNLPYENPNLSFILNTSISTMNTPPYAATIDCNNYHRIQHLDFSSLDSKIKSWNQSYIITCDIPYYEELDWMCPSLYKSLKCQITDISTLKDVTLNYPWLDDHICFQQNCMTVKYPRLGYVIKFSEPSKFYEIGSDLHPLLLIVNIRCCNIGFLPRIASQYSNKCEIFRKLNESFIDGSKQQIGTKAIFLPPGINAILFDEDKKQQGLILVIPLLFKTENQILKKMKNFVVEDKTLFISVCCSLLENPDNLFFILQEYSTYFDDLSHNPYYKELQTKLVTAIAKSKIPSLLSTQNENTNFIQNLRSISNVHE